MSSDTSVALSFLKSVNLQPKKGAVRWSMAIYIVPYQRAPVKAKTENVPQLRTSKIF